MTDPVDPNAPPTPESPFTESPFTDAATAGAAGGVPDGAERPPPPLPPLAPRRAPGRRPARSADTPVAERAASRRTVRQADAGAPADGLAGGEHHDTIDTTHRTETAGRSRAVRATSRSRADRSPSTTDAAHHGADTEPAPWSSGFRLAAGASFALALGLIVYGAVRPRSSNTSILGLVALPLVAVLAHQVVRRSARRERRFDLLGIAMLGLGLRACGAFFRFSAPVDALVYHQEGSRIAPALRGLDFGVDTGRSIPGTGWIRYVSGITHAFVIDDMFVTFMIFTFLSFVGVWLCYLAFVRAIPDGDHKRYALLIFLWPSLIYWPSSIGKEAWMIFGLGIASWGVARIVTGNASIGLAVTALGLVTMSLVRPHVALMVVVGLGVALLARPKSRTTFRLSGRITIVVILLVGGSLVVSRTSEVLKVDITGSESITNALESTQDQTDQGGAQFSSAIVRTPLDYPVAFVTVWFRPLPIEVRDATGLLSAAENLVLIGLVLASWRRLIALPRALITTPYATYAAAYSLVFVYAFAVIANFGILARQRTQGLVLFFVLLCIPAVTVRRSSRLPGRDRAHEERPARRLPRESAPPAVPDLIPDPAPPGRAPRP